MTKDEFIAINALASAPVSPKTLGDGEALAIANARAEVDWLFYQQRERQVIALEKLAGVWTTIEHNVVKSEPYA